MLQLLHLLYAHSCMLLYACACYIQVFTYHEYNGSRRSIVLGLFNTVLDFRYCFP